MALKINATPVLTGKAAKDFLKSVEENSSKKVSIEEVEKMKAFAKAILEKARI